MRSSRPPAQRARLSFIACNGSARGASRGTGVGAGAAARVCTMGAGSAGGGATSIGAARDRAAARLAASARAAGAASCVTPAFSAGSAIGAANPGFAVNVAADRGGVTTTSSGAAGTGCSVAIAGSDLGATKARRAAKVAATTTAATISAISQTLRRRCGSAIGGSGAAFASSDRSAVRLAVAATDWLGLSRRVPVRALAAASKGCVTVAANARLRAELQSAHSFAPGRLARPQIRHFFIVRRRSPGPRRGAGSIDLL